MNSNDLPPLGDDVRDVMARAAGAEAGPPRGAKARVLDGVESALGVGPPGSGPSAGHGAAEPPRARTAGPVGSLRAAQTLVTFGLGAAVGAVAVWSARSPAEPAPVVHVDSAPAIATGAVIATPSAIASEPAPAAAPEAATDLRAPARPTSAAPAAVDTSSAERALLDRARHQLEEKDGASALGSLDQHARRYPNGVLVQEREAMMVRALLLVGRVADARARADRFRARYPDSLLLPATEGAFGSSGL